MEEVVEEVVEDMASCGEAEDEHPRRRSTASALRRLANSHPPTPPPQTGQRMSALFRDPLRLEETMKRNLCHSGSIPRGMSECTLFCLGCSG